jgi:hypothetical protein
VKPHTGSMRCTWEGACRPRRRRFLARMKFQPRSSGRPRCRRTAHWSNKRLGPDPCRRRADQGCRCPRSGIVRASRPGCSFGRGRRTCSRSTRRPRTGPIRIRWNSDKVARSSAGHNFRRCCFAGCIEIRTHSRCRLCNSVHTRHCCKHRVSNPRVANPDRCLCRRRFAARSRPSPSRTTSRTPCPWDRGCTNPNRRKGRCSHRWCDRCHCTPGR